MPSAVADTWPADAAELFWQYSLHIYGQDGAAWVLLHLQDDAEMDVNLLLLLGWTAGRKKQVDGIALRALEDATAQFQSACLLPLRGVRKSLKRFASISCNATIEHCRALVKDAELQAEKISQSLLIETLRELALVTAENETDALDYNISTYFKCKRYSDKIYSTRLRNIL